MDAKDLAEFQQILDSLTPKPTELELLIKSSGKAHESYLHYLNKIEKAVQDQNKDSRHTVCNIVIDWLTNRVKDSWAVCSTALRKDYDSKNYRPIGYSLIG